MLKTDINIISSNKFAILIYHLRDSNISLTKEFIKKNGGGFYMNNAQLNITGTALELINIINYMNTLNVILILCNIHLQRLGIVDDVLKELSRINRNLQIEQLV